MFGFFKKPKPKIEARALSYSPFFSEDFGVNEALSIPAINVAVDVIASSIASLPIKCKDARMQRIFKKPNEKQTSYEFVNTIMRSLLVDGNAYIEKVYDSKGQIVGLSSHYYRQISVEKLHNQLRYRHTDYFGIHRVLLAQDVVHIKHNSEDKETGYSKVDQCKRAIEIAIGQSQNAKAYLDNGSTPKGILSSDQTFGDDLEAFERMRDSWNQAHKGAKNSGKTALLEYGFKYSPMSHNMLESDFARLFQIFSVNEVSRIFNISPVLLNSEAASATGWNNTVEGNKSLLNRTLRPWLMIIESALYSDLGLDIEFDTGSFLRLSQQERFNSYETAIGSGFLTVNDVRKLEGLEPLGPQPTPQ